MRFPEESHQEARERLKKELAGRQLAKEVLQASRFAREIYRGNSIRRVLVYSKPHQLVLFPELEHERVRVSV